VVLAAVYLLAADKCLSPKTRSNPPLSTIMEGGDAMIPPLFFYQHAILGLLWLCVMLHLAWPTPGPVSSRWPGEPETPGKARRKRSQESTPCVGLPHTPPGALWAHEAGSVSKVEMVTPMALIYKGRFPSISTFETPPARAFPRAPRRSRA
jgi:hypothetical protein